MEPFKNLFNPDVIEALASALTRVAAARGVPFDGAGFVDDATRDLEALELKERSRQIAAALATHLPARFPEAAELILGILHREAPPESAADAQSGDGAGVRGFVLLPVADYVAAHGQNDLDLSFRLLREITQRSTAEFAIRPFLVAHEDRTLQVLEAWTRDPNHHVRRLVSEGTRPRLPWGTRLQRFVEDPTPVLSLLERLKDDPEEYVRRSVANNLNDIAKDHPDLVSDVAARWLDGASPERARLVRHACRSLIKQGHPGVLAALGYGPPKVALEGVEIETPTVVLGDALTFSVTLCSEGTRHQELIIDYVIHHRKANGSTSAKVFKWKTIKLAPGERHHATRRHPIKRITTRRYHPGMHAVELQVNGRVLGHGAFELVV